MFARIVCASLFAAVACVVCACERAPSPPRTSQLLITIDAIAPAHLSPFGGPVAMPNLQALATAGTSYVDTMSTTPVARPALVTILTGMSPDRSGVRDNIHDALRDAPTTVAEAARRAGFETAAFVGSPFASYSSGLQRGFDLFDGPEAVSTGPAQHRPPVVAAPDVADHFKQWLAGRAHGKPFFAWVHLADLNGQATIPPDSVGRSVKMSGDPNEDYDKTLSVIDDALGAITSSLKDDPGAKGCAVLIVGTHGVYLGEGGRRGDAFWLADETLRVPLVRVARLSDAAPGNAKRDPRPTWLPDVAASLRRAVGANLPEGQDGVPLDEAPPAGRIRLAWTYAPDDQLAWPPLTAGHDGGALSVFSASKDGRLQPIGEVSTRAAAAAASRPALPRRRILTQAIRDQAARAHVKLGPGGTQAVQPDDADAWLRDLQVDRWLLRFDRLQIARRWSRELLEKAPDSLAALVTRLYMLSGQPSDELTELRDKLLELYPDRAEALHWASHVSSLTYDYEATAFLLDAAIAVGPVEPEMYYDRACVHVLRGEVKPALAMLDTALKAGYRNWDWIDKDPELAGIRSNPEFVALLRTHGR